MAHGPSSMAATSRTYKGHVIHTEYIGGDRWLAYILESVVSGMGETPSAAIDNLLEVLSLLGDSAIDTIQVRGETDVGT